MEKTKYVQPEIEVLEVKIEEGFAQSGTPGKSPWQEAGFDGSGFGSVEF